MQVKRLNATHYDEILSLLNAVFTKQNKREMDFEKEIPKMCVRDDEHMGCHFGIFEDGKLVACMGVYPFDVMVAGVKLRFATTGNLAVHWDYEGRGYMGALFDMAMAELDRLDIDVARLGGLRSRYNRYGFEACGQEYSFTFTEKNRTRKFPNYNGGIIFAEIGAEDSEALAFATSLYNKNAISLPRTVENTYQTMTTWKSIPYIALRNNEMIGYLCARVSKPKVSEFDAVDISSMTDIICAWQERVGDDVIFSSQPHRTEVIRVLSTVCESSIIASPSHFKIRNWAKAIDAFFKLKASYSQVIKGELRIGISDYGTVCLYSDGKGCVGCRDCEEAPDVTLDTLSAARYIFGPYPPVCTAHTTANADAWLPLPLSWNTLDRV